MHLKALAGLLITSAAFAVGAPAGAAPSKEPDPVTCSNRTDRHALAVRMRDEVEKFRVPPRFLDQLPPGTASVFVDRTRAEATIERRIDEVTVLDRTSERDDAFFGEDQGALRSCGPPPTVTGVDSIRVGLGKHSEGGELLLNMQYGPLAPGFGDEGDGSSEIELDARLGEGFLNVAMTRGPDSIALHRSNGDSGPSRINLNAGEAVFDYDVTVGGKSLIALFGGGGDDTLRSSGLGNVSESIEPFGLGLIGGQGADTLEGGNGIETFFGGSGPDTITAGGGTDIVLAIGHAPDQIDCGPGQDFVIVTRPGNRLRRCESVEDADDLAFRPTPREVLRGKRFPRLLQRR